MVKAIIFDCFGVLTADLWHEFRMSLPVEQQSPASDLNHQYCEGEITKSEFLKSVSELTGKSESTVGQLIDNEQYKNLQLIDHIKDLKKYYKIGLLSNVASNWIRDYFLTKEEQELFDAFIFSFEVGMTKPDPRIYRMAAERLGVLPEECVFIDDIDRYAMAAEEQGMQGLVYENLQSLKKQLNKILATNNN